jgi:hypothetical protein
VKHAVAVHVPDVEPQHVAGYAVALAYCAPDLQQVRCVVVVKAALVVAERPERRRRHAPVTSV